ncbi:MAG TPA: ATP-dependent sacrificial sulfur transferase LarE [bacterium]|nr:ATP-dependent sacrificial sulfur transferase LarE [bacterium]
MDTNEKILNLRADVRSLGSAVIAFSGGTDSTLLARIASEELPGRFVLVMADFEGVQREEMRRAGDIAVSLNCELIIVKPDMLNNPGFAENGPERCYHCKKKLIEEINTIKVERGYEHIADGTNADDLLDYRPGARAAAEAGVKNPIADALMSKEEVRVVSKMLGLPNWELPAQACLASRVAYGMEITAEKLGRIEKAEKKVKLITGSKNARVRDHGELARIELSPETISHAASSETARLLVDALVELGYHYITLDLRGYRTGSMNELLEEVSAEKPGKNGK